MRDYSSFGLPYSIKNFIFFGDDTMSALASVDLTAISISAVPEPGTAAVMLAGLALLGAALCKVPPRRIARSVTGH